MTPIKITPEITFRQLTKHDATCRSGDCWVARWVPLHPVPFDYNRDALGRATANASRHWLRLRCNDPRCTATAIVSLAFISKLPAGEKRKARRGGVR